MSRSYIIGLYKDEEVLIKAVENIRAEHVHIHDVLSPFPVHGLDEAFGLKESRLHIGGFFYGLTGTTIALSFMSWVFGTDWPMNVGGKPHFPLPAFIPITFEFTVLCASIGMFLTFLVINKMYPGKLREVLDPRTTDDMFGIVFHIKVNTPQSEVDRINQLLQINGADEIKARTLSRKYL